MILFGILVFFWGGGWGGDFGRRDFLILSKQENNITKKIHLEYRYSRLSKDMCKIRNKLAVNLGSQHLARVKDWLQYARRCKYFLTMRFPR